MKKSVHWYVTLCCVEDAYRLFKKETTLLMEKAGCDDILTFGTLLCYMY